MAPAVASNLLSPAELDYLHSSLLLTPPIRPDSRRPTQFRPLIAETDILQGTNGSARIYFLDGTEAIVGIKGEVEKTSRRGDPSAAADDNAIATDDMQRGEKSTASESILLRRGNKNWVEMTIEIPGFRDDDPLPVFLAAMLNEALLTTGELANKLYINRRWHWKLFIDVCSTMQRLIEDLLFNPSIL
jgi:exosome complex component RRP42